MSLPKDLVKTLEVVKPKRLAAGDTVAVLSTSWGGPAIFPKIYELGVRNLKANFHLQIKEYPTTRGDPELLHGNPEMRAKDVNNAFSDREVAGIISSIGGDDSIRILPYLSKEAIRSNPKVLMGYSDTTTLLSYCNQLGLVTFHGPSIMAGFSQMENLPATFTAHVAEMLFHSKASHQYSPFEVWSDGYPDWAEDGNIGKVNPPRKDDGWRWLQGMSIVRGELFGGNIEVLEGLKGTEFWPSRDFWRGKILFLETSEEKPSRAYIRRCLRNYGVQGIFDKITGLLFGRARDFSDEEKKDLDENIVTVVAGEFRRRDLPIVTNMDFGHTDPQFILPLGARAAIDCGRRKFALVEPPVL